MVRQVLLQALLVTSLVTYVSAVLKGSSRWIESRKPCKDENRVLCNVPPCHRARCARYPFAQCRNNYCGMCHAEFWLNTWAGYVEVTADCNRPRFGKHFSVEDARSGERKECVNKDLCSNGGHCYNIGGTDRCSCLGTGYTGRKCTHKISPFMSDKGCEPKNCGFIPPCQISSVANCERFPTAECRSSFCPPPPPTGLLGCSVEFWLGDKEVTSECNDETIQPMPIQSNEQGFKAKMIVIDDREECVNKDLCSNGGHCSKMGGTDRCNCYGTGYTGRKCTNKISSTPSTKPCPGDTAVNCGWDPPCQRMENCENFPTAECRVSYCGRWCSAEFWLYNKEVTSECKDGQDWIVEVQTALDKQAGTWKAKVAIQIEGDVSTSKWMRLANNQGLADFGRGSTRSFVVSSLKKIGKIQSVKLRYGSWGWWKPTEVRVTDKATTVIEYYINRIWLKKPQIISLVPVKTMPRGPG